ncbi:hypothetical protein E1295_07820 [Nonomuraea mesophila]|uniref:Uncharacterized protein n=1 Tax=Nonomuraea mesophila TaxID=2530382 RepID=A0A4R5FUA9_9ACTN|nr:hypothetical protein [Nonomuraea mesophila]TDE57606.1 hypothetical protein E1295_07820 [Nonomuraea mesophila]
MTTLALHLSVATPMTSDTRSISLLVLATMITLTLAVIRGLIRRTHLVMVVSGTSALLVVLAVLGLAYLITFGAI